MEWNDSSIFATLCIEAIFVMAELQADTGWKVSVE